MVVEKAQHDEQERPLDELEIDGALVRGRFRLGQER